MTIIKKNLPEDVVNAIEAVSYELEARKDVIAAMLDRNADISTDAFNAYQKELVEFKVKFETLKKEIQKEFVDDVPSAVHWDLDYATRELSITVA